MPPIKGKMMGRMGRSMQPTVSNFERVKNLGGLTKKKARMHLSGDMLDNDIKDDKLLKLRYPTSIRQILPSVKRFRGGKNCPQVGEDSNSSASEGTSELSWEERTTAGSVILGAKRSFRGGNKPKYFLRPAHEEKFKGMVWDLAVSPTGDVVVSCADGMFICGDNLRIKQKLETIVLAGGISFMSDGRIIAVCRNKDTVNVFSSSGEFLSSFSAGSSPMSVNVDAQDRLIVCDPGAKSVYIYTVDGTLVSTIEPRGTGYNLRWPLYTGSQSDGSFLISDCHSQTVLRFDSDGKFVRDMKLGTFAGNQVLRPHGLSIMNDDVFLIDNAMDSVEVFDKKDTFIQTLLPQEEGHTFRPKVLSVCEKFLVIGGLTGVVKLYKFVADEELDVKPPKPVKTPVKKKIANRTRTVPKLKIEIKNEPVVSEMNGESEASSAVKDDEDDEEDCESVVPNGAESNEIKPKLVTTEDNPVVLDSDSGSEDDELENESENESENEGEQVEVLNSSFVVERVSDYEEDDSDNEMDTDEEEETENGEKVDVEEVIILDDE